MIEQRANLRVFNTRDLGALIDRLRSILRLICQIDISSGEVLSVIKPFHEGQVKYLAEEYCERGGIHCRLRLTALWSTVSCFMRRVYQ